MPSDAIAWLGGSYFRDEFAALGHRVVHIPMAATEILDWNTLVARTGGEPAGVIYADCSLPPPLVGMERFPCPTVFYAVDSHIHSWYPMYAQGFDLVAVSLRDHLPRFRQRLGEGRIIWLPPFPLGGERPPDRPPVKEWDILFAGKVDPELTPGRHALLREIRARFPGLAVRQGKFGDLFPRARVVLNIAEAGDLNFRVFEAMACGACLLTPEVGHGQSLLFSEGVHMTTYPPNDPDQVVARACALLDAPDVREAMGRAASAEIDARHRPHHRAATLAQALDALAPNTVADRLAKAGAIHAKYLRLVYLHWAEASDDPARRAAFLAAGAVP
ncbi:glycosyltransferase [Pseudodesulfovibrio sp. F-1]|uniref:Glycosyltransferase n=1 Tax=Pseudodesulfovibrio alkaliphilus TaxID=2661613 RepID=A0A7K1KKK4_9BACT|nr:glycosyltransferase [Pseudodesulfovibrio alkaliphilus]